MIKNLFKCFVYAFILLFIVSCQNQIDMREVYSAINGQKDGITFTITYKNVDDLDNPNPTVYRFNEDVTLQPVLKDGYGFINWYTTQTFNPSTVITGWNAYDMSSDLVLYAKYEQEVFNIIYHNVDRLDNPNPTIYDVKKDVTLLPVKKPGYVFDGWYTDSAFTGNPVSNWKSGDYNSHLHFYAKWITYNSFDIDIYDISELEEWLNNYLDITTTDNKVKISGTATTSDLITLSSKIKNMEQYIEELDLTDLNVTQFYNSNSGAGGNGFMQTLNHIKKIILPFSLKILSEGAFARCSSLEEVVFNEGLTDILWSGFANCPKLKEVTIPDSVEFIAQTAFYECTSLEKVNISKNSNLEIIGLEAFRACTKLTEFYFPSKVTHLDNRGATTSREDTYGSVSSPGSFHLCSGLKTLTFSKNIRKINNQVFEGCNNITTINFEGTPEEWAAVEKGANNGSLLSATVNYNYVIQ